MALTKGTNSYVTEAEADDYMEDRVGATDWNAVSQTDRNLKERALVTAWEILDRQQYAGRTSEEDQPMAWPREATVYDARTGRNVTTKSSDLATGEYAPLTIKKAQYELALHLYKNPNIVADASTVQDLSLGSINLTGISKVSIMPSYVRRFLSPWLINGTNSWFRAN